MSATTKTETIAGGRAKKIDATTGRFRQDLGEASEACLEIDRRISL